MALWATTEVQNEARGWFRPPRRAHFHLSILVIVYVLLTRQQDQYRDAGSQYFDERDRQAVQRRLVRRLEALGYTVSLEPTSPAA